MPIYSVKQFFTTYVEQEIEANSQEEAEEKAVNPWALAFKNGKFPKTGEPIAITDELYENLERWTEADYTE